MIEPRNISLILSSLTLCAAGLVACSQATSPDPVDGAANATSPTQQKGFQPLSEAAKNAECLEVSARLIEQANNDPVVKDCEKNTKEEEVKQCEQDIDSSPKCGSLTLADRKCLAATPASKNPLVCEKTAENPKGRVASNPEICGDTFTALNTCRLTVKRPSEVLNELAGQLEVRVGEYIKKCHENSVISQQTLPKLKEEDSGAKLVKSIRDLAADAHSTSPSQTSSFEDMPCIEPYKFLYKCIIDNTKKVSEKKCEMPPDDPCKAELAQIDSCVEKTYPKTTEQQKNLSSTSGAITIQRTGVKADSYTS